MKVAILGSTGMLGIAVTKVMEEKFGEENVFLSTRQTYIAAGQTFPFAADQYDNRYVFCKIPEVDYVINCIGIIKPHMIKDMQQSIYLNAIFPRRLADYCAGKNMKLIHVSTDCVYSGNLKVGKSYNEHSDHDCTDNYGQTKSLGECVGNAMVIRTSIIGEEQVNFKSLLEWVKSTDGTGSINGYTNHYWNGMTTEQYGKCCAEIIQKDLWEVGMFTLHSDVVSKADLVQLIASRFGVDITVNRVGAPQGCNRAMSSVKSLQKLLHIPPLKEQIEEM